MSLKSQFKKQRADYYADLAARLEQPGVKLLQVFEKDAARYPDAPQGKLAAIWARRLDENGAVLADAWEGNIPEDDLASVRVLEHIGTDALISGLRDLARVARLRDSIQAGLYSTIAMSLVMVLMAICALTVIPVYAVGTIEEALGVPTSQWAAVGKSLAALAGFVKAWGMPLGVTMLAMLISIVWSINQWTGSLRHQIEQWCEPFKTVRDIRAMSFVATLSILCKERGLGMMTLGDALELLRDATSNTYMRWRLTELVERIHDTGAAGSDNEALSSNVLESGLMSPQALNRFIDTEEYGGFAKAAEVTSAYIEATLLPNLLKKFTRLRWTLMVASIGTLLVVTGMVIMTSIEMKGVIMNSLT
jgi:type II secretory pathway component PulF